MSDPICKVLYPEEFHSNIIYEHHQVRSDLEALLERSGYKDRFIRQYRQRLRFLEERLFRCTDKTDWFESLKGEPDLYAMKLKGQLNIRLIFKFCQLHDNQTAIILCGFHERNTSNYTSAIVEAKQRFKEIEEVLL